MGIQENEFFYSKQLRSYVLQFIAIFTGLQVQTGKRDNDTEQLISVPIHYAHKDRVVAAIKANNTQNTPIRLPTMSAYMSQINIAENRMKGTGTERRRAYVPVGGMLPDDVQVVYQRMPVPFNIQMDLNIFVSNTDQHFQILEQILPFFDPQLSIQTDDAPLNWTRLTHVKLTGITTETNNPIGTSPRIIQSSIQFEMPIYLDTPADIRKNVIQNIYLRVGAVNSDLNDSYGVISELDQLGIEYELNSSSDVLPFS